MILGFIGTVGSGKTLSMTKQAYEYYKKGMTIYSNYHLNFPYERLDKTTFDELISETRQLQDCVILLDELHIWLDSRSSGKKKNKTITYFILQTRKRNVRLLFSTQHFHQVDKRLRDTVDILTYCTNVTDKQSLVQDGNETIFIMQESFFQYEPDKVVKRVFKANPYFILYDTREIIDFIED